MIRSRPLVALACFCALVVAAPLLQAAERLSDDQLDAVSAGRITITATADATAIGTQPRTATATETFAAQQRLRAIKLRRASRDLTIVTAAPERDVEIGFARASARAEGIDPQVSCAANIRFSGPATFQTSAATRSTGPGFANCLCASYGTFVLPH